VPGDPQQPTVPYASAHVVGTPPEPEPLPVPELLLTLLLEPLPVPASEPAPEPASTPASPTLLVLELLVKLDEMLPALLVLVLVLDPEPLELAAQNPFCWTIVRNDAHSLSFAMVTTGVHCAAFPALNVIQHALSVAQLVPPPLKPASTPPVVPAVAHASAATPRPSAVTAERTQRLLVSFMVTSLSIVTGAPRVLESNSLSDDGHAAEPLRRCASSLWW